MIAQIKNKNKNKNKKPEAEQTKIQNIQWKVVVTWQQQKKKINK